MTDVRVLLCTVPGIEVGKTLAHGLVERHLCACVNLVPGLTSVYRWEGKVAEDEEVLMVIKTRAEHVEAVSGYIDAHHPYTVPEVIALDVTGGHVPYLDWVKAETVTGET